jgi:hypothetical protein
MNLSLAARMGLTCIFAGLTVALPTCVNAQASESASLPLPFGECRLGHWTGTRNLDAMAEPAKASCLVQWLAPIGSGFSVRAAVRAGYADALLPESGRTDGTTSRIREAFIEYDSGWANWHFGRQIIAWGRADRFNPTDNLSPRDFTFQSQEDDEQRSGITALSVKSLVTGPWSVIGVYVPRYARHVVPVGALPQGTYFGRLPEKSEFALKLDRTGEGVDGSISYYRGFDRLPRFTVDSTLTASNGIPVFRGNFSRQETLGVDVSFNMGKFSLRGEAATSRYRPQYEAEATVHRAVIGLDRDIFESANINLQFFTIRRSAYDDSQRKSGREQLLSAALGRLNSEFARVENGATFRYADRLLNDRLRVEFGGVFDLTQRGHVLRPRLSYSFSDSIRLSGGVDFFRGSQQSFFGVRAANQVSYVELAWLFQ